MEYSVGGPARYLAATFGKKPATRWSSGASERQAAHAYDAGSSRTRRGPVVQVVDEDEQAFLQAWQDDPLFMKLQPGFISTQLHRGIGESTCYLNYAVWEINCSFPGCIHESRVPGEDFGLSVFGRGNPAPVPKGRRSGCLRCIRPQSNAMSVPFQAVDSGNFDHTAVTPWASVAATGRKRTLVTPCAYFSRHFLLHIRVCNPLFIGFM